MSNEQADLDAFAPPTPKPRVDQVPARVQDDPGLIHIIEQFGGWIKSVHEADLGDTRMVWIEDVRPRARRRPGAPTSEGRGVPVAVQLEETIKLGKYSAYEKAQPKGSARPWQLVWSKTGEPLGVGLFTTETLANAYRRR